MNKFNQFIEDHGSTKVAMLLTKETGKKFAVNRVQNWKYRGVPASEKVHFIAISGGDITIKDLIN